MPDRKTGRVHFRGPDCAVPAHLRNGLRLYIEEGILPSAFLQAIICNDLDAAVGKVDRLTETPHIVGVTRWMHNNAPSKCWRTATAMQAWIDRFHPPERTS